MPNRRQFLRATGQFAETALVAGPADEEIPQLRKYGYRPEIVSQSTQSRLAWESSYRDVLINHPADRAELRVRLMARELVHEHLDVFNEIKAEYRIDLRRLMRPDPDRPRSMRTDMMLLSDRIPSMRIATDMKVEVFRDLQRNWTVNVMHDIDAASLAVPYCHVVMLDRDATDLLKRSKAHDRHGTVLLTEFAALPAVLRDLEHRGGSIVNKSGWDDIGPPAPFCAHWSDLPRQ
jgi:hypothetical protein